MAVQSTSANPMWGGHYASGPDALMQEINASIHFDKLLYAYDIQGSLAHVAMLAKTEILTEEEAAQITKGLEQVRGEIEAGGMQWNNALEDIHMHVESRLKEIIGDVAGKLHTARSRNDQVATDFRLYVREALDELDGLLKALQSALLERAEEHAETIMPGFTHLQTAQPVTLGHHLLAYVEMFGRDRRRVKDARAGMNYAPLGAAALAGTSFPIDREMTAKELEFEGPMRNSLDAVSDRDFALEYLAVMSIVATHLSRFAEELVIFSSAQFGFITLSEAFTSGSSIMPQKRNPDAAELIRAKSGRVVGNMVSLFQVMKGLTLAYNKDMQEDKEPVFDTHAHIRLGLLAMIGMVQDMQVHSEVMYRAASQGYATATDLADWLVRVLGMPFRQAHHVTGSIVRLAEEKSCALAEISLEEMQQIESGITEDVFNVLTVEHSVASRTSLGGTAPENVKQEIQLARKRYEI